MRRSGAAENNTSGKSPPGWDLIDIHNTLQITATPGNKFHIYITSLDLSNNPNPVAGFLSSESYSWRIARTTGGIKGFDRAVFDLDPTGFQNSLGGGEFVVDLSSDEKDLILRFKPNPSYTILDQPAWNEEGPFDLLHSHNTLLNSTNPVIGAVQAIALDPANPSVAFLGSVGGGIWETTDLTDPSPVWEPLGKNLPSLAITSLALSPFDKGSNPLTMGTSLDDLVLFAGTGLSSSAGKDGVAAGMFRSKDGGMTWEQVGDFAGQKIVSIAASKLTAKLLFATTIGPLALQDVVGLYRSTDNGDHWDRLSGNGGLPEGQLWDIVEDPSISGQFYLSMAEADLPENGIYRTTNGDTGNANDVAWQKVVAGIGVGLQASKRIRLAVSPATGHPLFAGIIDSGEHLGGVFRSLNGGTTWTAVGTAPQTNPGQGLLHFAIVADPTNAQFVYVSGSTTSGQNDERVGIAFRGNTATNIWTPITATTAIDSTANHTAPHADTRNMVMSADGSTLYAGTDGGLYRLSTPQNSAALKWSFVGGNLRITEIGNSVAWDHNTNSIFAGTQDNGVIRQTSVSSDWTTMTAGDGNFVGIGYNGLTSTRYFMGNNFSAFFRQDFTTPDPAGLPVQIKLRSGANANDFSGLDNTIKAGDLTDFKVASSDEFPDIPFAINAVDPNRLLLGLAGLYESTNQGNTIQLKDLSSIAVSALAYGGKENGFGRPDVIYAARGNQILVREPFSTEFKPAVTLKTLLGKGNGLPGVSQIRHIALDPEDWRTAVAVGHEHIWLTSDGGNSWDEITGNLSNLTSNFEAISIVNRDGQLVLVVGAGNGVYRTFVPDASVFANLSAPAPVWTRFGTHMPNVQVTDLQYDSEDDVLIAGTLGRGAWSMFGALAKLFIDPVLHIDAGGGNDIVRLILADNVAFSPPQLRVIVNSVTTATVPLTAIGQVSIHSGDGNDTLIIDSSFGEIVVPQGIRFDGENGSDTLRFEGVTTTALRDTTDSGADVRVLGRQKVVAMHTENFQDGTLFSSLPDVLRRTFEQFTNMSRRLDDPGLLAQELPLLGSTLGAALNGADFNDVSGVGDEGGAGSSSEQLVSDQISALITRLFETGHRAFQLSQLGNTITTNGQLLAALDALDSTPNNVTIGGNVVTLQIKDKKISANARLDTELLGGLIRLQGNVNIAATITLNLQFGTDSDGFFVSTDSLPQPELVISNLEVSGTVTATGVLGLLEVELKDATIGFGPDVKIAVDLKEPGPDPYTGTTDGKIRLYDLDAPATDLFAVTVTGGPGDDITLTGQFAIGPIGPDDGPLFNLPLATLQIAWPDIHDSLHVRIKAMNPAGDALLKFLNFSPGEMVGELRRLLNELTELPSTALLDVKLPFGAGLSLGGSFDFSTAFLDKVYAGLVTMKLVASTGNGHPSDELASGKISADAVFDLTIGDAAPVTVTVTKASTVTNTGLPELVADFNDALATAGIGDKVLAILDGGQIALVLISGTSLEIDGDDNDPTFTEIGFTNAATNIEVPKFPTLQSLLAELEELLDPDGPGGLSFDLNPQFDVTTNLLTFAVSFGYHLDKSTSFKADPNIGLGDLAEFSASGDFNLSINLNLSFTLGFDFNPLMAPKMITSLALPPPSSGRLTADSSFDIVLNDDDRFHINLLKSDTAGFTQLSQLVAYLNSKVVGTFQGMPLNHVIRFVQASTGNAIFLEAINEDLDADGKLDTANEDTNGDHILDPSEDLDNDGHLDVNEDTVFANGVLDSVLGKVNSIAIEADTADPIATEVGFNSTVPARETIKGLFLQDTQLTGTITVSANNLAAGAHFAIFGISTSGGTATGTASLTLKFKNPHDSLHPNRIDLDLLLKHIDDLSNYITPDTQLTGSVDIHLKNITISPNLPTLSGQPLIPPGSEFRVFIPDIHDLHYNADPYNGTNTGTFVTYPDLGSVSDFRCVSFLDVASALQSLSDSLSGLKEFSFLSQRLPLINVSISDILDFAGDLANAFKKLAAGDTETIETLESDLRQFFGVSPDKLWIKIDDLPAPKTTGGTGGTPATAVFNPSGLNNALDFTATSNGAAFNDVKIDFVDDGSLTAGTDTATASYDSGKKILTIHYNATYTTANTVVSVVNSAGVPFTVTLDSSGGGDSANNGTGIITETAIKFHLEYSLSYGKFMPLQFSLGDLVGLAGGDPTLTSFLAGVSDIIQVEGSGSLNVTASASLVFEFGLDVSSPCHFEPFVYDTTGLALKAAVRGTALNFKVGIGALSVSVKNGTATLDGDGNPNTNDSAAFTVGFNDNNGDGRHYFREDIFNLDNLNISLTAGASAVLPLFALGSLPIGSTSDNNHDGYPDNDLVVIIADLTKVFGGVTDPAPVVIITPDIASLFKQVNVCDLVTHPELLVDGLDAFLGTLQSALGNRVFGRNLPVIGNELGKAADFIGTFRTGTLANIRQTLAAGGDPITLVKKAIFNALGKPGLDILVKADNPNDPTPPPLTSADQVSIICVGTGLKFDLRLKKSIALVDTTANPINFQLGIPGLGFEVHANVKVEIGFDFKLKFGINPQDGFYFDTSTADELMLYFNVTIPKSHATGQLLFLQLDVSDESDGKDLKGKPREPSSFGGCFKVDLKDPIGPGDNKLTIADLMNPALNFDKLIDAQLEAHAKLHLDFAVSFGGSTVIPRLVGEFDLDWVWKFGEEPKAPKFGFHNLALDIGSFVSDFIKPILVELHKYTEPLGPVVEVMTKRLPLISDLAGRDYTLLDLAEQWGTISPGTRRFIDVLITIIQLANNNSVPNNGNVLLFLGQLNLDLDKFGKVKAQLADLNLPKADITKPPDSASASYTAKVGKLGIDFPFLKVSEIFKLFTGKPISFVEFHLPTLDFKAGFQLVIPIFGPLFVKFGGSISAHIDLFVGYDSFGLQKFLSSSQKNVLDIFDGFYIKDVDANGVDVPEVTFTGNLWASGSIDFGFAEAGVRGGFDARIDFNLNDSDHDGRVHISELIANAQKDVRCIFDIHGKFTAYLEAFLKIDIFFIHINEMFRFAEITLLEFNVTCPEPKLADYVKKLGGGEIPNADGDGILRLNIGKYAKEREFGDQNDGDEAFTVTHIEGDASSGEKVEVSFMGIKQTYIGVKTIFADAGEGNDVIDMRRSGLRWLRRHSRRPGR